LQQAFLDAEALQCGYCTTGMIMQAVALLDEQKEPAREDIIHHMNGNICRCGTYARIVAAIEQAGKVMKGGGPTASNTFRSWRWNGTSCPATRPLRRTGAAASFCVPSAVGCWSRSSGTKRRPWPSAAADRGSRKRSAPGCMSARPVR